MYICDKILACTHFFWTSQQQHRQNQNELLSRIDFCFLFVFS